MPIKVIVDGREWRLFGLNYSTSDGEFSTYIYAISEEHAAAVVEELRQTARLGGMLEGWISA